MRTLAIVPILAAAAALAQPKVLVIGVDGLRPDVIGASATPAIMSLVDEGVLATDARCEDLTFSGPNWSSILHGVHRDRHNVTTNDYRRGRLDECPDLFAFLEAHNPSWNTARFTTWDAIYKFQPTGADIDIFHEYSEGGDELATRDAERLLAGTHDAHEGVDIDAMFLYIADVDVAGHEYGFHPDVPGYLDAVRVADAQIARVLDAVRSREGYAGEDWLVILTTDHGGSMDKGHSGNTPEKRRIPFLVSGRSVVRTAPYPPPENVDCVPTALAHMGVPITPDMRLDGRPVGLTPTHRPRVKLGENVIANPGAELDRPMSDQAIHLNLTGWLNPGPGGVTVVGYGSGDGYPAASDPGPGDRGDGFFCGGSAARTVAIQRIDLADLAQAIDSTRATYTLSAHLGGFGEQEDRAVVRVRWLDEQHRLLGVAQIGPVTATDRGGLTGLLTRETTGTPPSLARWAEVEIECVRAEGGGNDGYADSLSLVFEMAE